MTEQSIAPQFEDGYSHSCSEGHPAKYAAKYPAEHPNLDFLQVLLSGQVVELGRKPCIQASQA